VPIQVANLSLEEVTLGKGMYIGQASPITVEETIAPTGCNAASTGRGIRVVEQAKKSASGKPAFIERKIGAVKRDGDLLLSKFNEYLQEKLTHLEMNDRRILEPVIRRYRHLFYGLGSKDLGVTSQVQHGIETGDATPVKRSPYRTPHALKGVVEEHIDDMLQKGIIVPSMSPWSSSIVLVRKKSKTGTVNYRFCVDYRALNSVTKPDAYPLPNITETLDSLGKSKIFSVLDMASGYFQIAIKPEDREKTAFSCHRGHFEFSKMAFGLNNAPATYQRCIDVVLMGLKGIDCLVYLDDIICFSATMEEHAEKLQHIFERLEKANFKIQPEKCVFATDTVEYLGHICTPDGIRPDPKKVKAVNEYPVPKTVKEIRSFLGLVGYYRRHIKDFAEMAKPLTILTKKEVPFVWTDEQQKAFVCLRQKLSTEPLLIYPDFSQPFIVACDASTKAVGAVLSQMRDGAERPVAYCSRQLNNAESKYSTTELELLAFLFATKQFRVYLFGHTFKVYTDHRALKWLLNLQDPSSRLTRWAVKLSEYDFIIEHRAGTQMKHADALSTNIATVSKEVTLSRDEIIEEQKGDVQCEEYKHQEKFWIDKDGMLYYKEATRESRIVIPRTLVEKLLQCYHELPFTAHQGVRRTLSWIGRKYWWSTMRNDVTTFIRQCDACARRKAGCRNTAPMGDALEARDFLDLVSLDVVGPLPVSNKGNRYLLTFIDHFTRFCDAIPIVRQDTETIAREFVMRIITQFGVPKRLLTDRGANFTSSLLKETCKLLRIQKLQTSSYNPRANGVCERMHKLLIDMLSHFVRKDAKNWDEYVPYAVMAYRAVPHCSLKHSPYYLVFGRDMRLPNEDDWKPHVTNKEVTEDDYERHVRTLADRLREAGKAAKQQSELSHETAKRYYDRQVKLERYRKGDLVYVHDPTYKRGKAKKFEYQFKGPFEIEHKVSPLVYKVKMDDGTFAIIHINRLKRAYNLDKEALIVKQKGRKSKRARPAETVPDVSKEIVKTENVGRGAYPASQVINTENAESSETEEEVDNTPQNQGENSEWTPGSLHLRRALRNNIPTDGVASRLRSRLLSRSGQEVDKASADGSEFPEASAENSNSLTNLRTQIGTPVKTQPVTNHTYNLRSRVGPVTGSSQGNN
jgi:transposase InsO family protein